MICGRVNSEIEATIRVSIYDSDGQAHEIEAIIDTGFNGWISLPPALVAFLNLPFRTRGRAILADGSESVFDIYETKIFWDNKLRRVAVDEADTTPLAGMALLHGYELCMQVINGGEVGITALPIRERDF